MTLQSQDTFDALFRPRVIAIAGASTKARTAGNRLIAILRKSGFDGRVYPIHPSATEIDGHKAYPSFADLPEIVDYAFVCVAAKAVPEMTRQASGRVQFLQVMTSGFGEVAEGRSLQEDLEEAVGESDLRLIGPNCIGMYSAPGQVSFVENSEFGSDGRVAVVSQSGGLSIDILRRGQQAGLDYHSVLSVGNALDINVTELLQRHLADDTIDVVGLYIENIADGRALFEVLTAIDNRKPVVVLKGGRTGAGQRAAASHTGSIADDSRLWSALARQTGVNIVDDLDEFLNLMLLYQSYTPQPDQSGTDVVLVGNGGGASVLASDHLSWSGLELHDFSAAAMKQLNTIDVPAGSSMTNPMDVPANALGRDDGKVVARILDAVADTSSVGAIVMHLNLTVLAGYNSDEIVGNAVKALRNVRDKIGRTTQVMLVLRADRSEETISRANKYRGEATAYGIAVFDELPAAARSLGAFKWLANYKKRRAAS